MKALLLAVLCVGTLRAADCPNILIILADDFGYDVLNSYGRDPKCVVTPKIDRHAADGAKFSEG